MQAAEVTLAKIFSTDHHYLVPKFQRPYVWNERDNWTPLWEDIRSATEGVEAEVEIIGQHQDPKTYFLGAIVTQGRWRQPRRLSSSNIIDGQQRLTTIQVVLASARRVAHDLQFPVIAGRFATLIDNNAAAISEHHPEDGCKIWPLPQDNEAFQWAIRAVDNNEPPKRPEHRIIRASVWFYDQIRDWAEECTDPELRLEHLFNTMLERMQLVHIVLDSRDDPQVIFEALNHRGVPLDAADLVKNLLFQLVDEQGDHEKADELLLQGWLPLDDSPWRDEITTGRVKRSRIDLILAYWLTARSRQEVQIEHLFSNFKTWMTASGERAADVIFDIRSYAERYLEVRDLPYIDPTSQLIDRMDATGMSTPWPIILYLYGRDEISDEQRYKAIDAIDSFLLRRGICRLTTSDYNRLFIQVLAAAQKSAPGEVGDTIVTVLARQTAGSRHWPSDEEFLEALTSSGLYRSVIRARLKTLLVGIENHLQSSGMTEPGRLLRTTERKVNIEHILPQEWGKNWSLPRDHSQAEFDRRVESVHRLGNLTLTTTKLNPSLSNKAWKPKKDQLRKHSLLRLTTSSVLTAPDSLYTDQQWESHWDESRIKLRGNYLANVALQVWPRPTLEETNSPAG